MIGYKNGNSAKAVFFGKRKQMRALYEVKGDDIVKKEKKPGKVEAGVKKRGKKQKETKVEQDGDTEKEEK